MSSTPAPQDSFPYPSGSVIAVLADEAALEAARDRLTLAGFAADHVEVLHGEDGLARIDVEGDRHGHKGSIMRRLQAVFSEDADHMRSYVEHLRDGRYVVAVGVGEDEAAKQRAANAFAAAQPLSLNYYAENYVEDLAAGA